MTKTEFYETIKQYALKEMKEQGKKYTELSISGDINKAQTHLGASNEAEKFYKMIEAMWVDSE